MRLVLALAVLTAAAPLAAAQTRIVPHAGATTASGGAAGTAFRVTTQGARPVQAGRLAQRYRGIAVNRSPRTATSGPRASSGLVLGNVVMPTLGTPQERYVRANDSAFRLQERQRARPARSR